MAVGCNTKSWVANCASKGSQVGAYLAIVPVAAIEVASSLARGTLDVAQGAIAKVAHTAGHVLGGAVDLCHQPKIADPLELDASFAF